jgi:two-component sensor histidine kinase
MVLHELATNASKYGALSAPAGHVDVAWTREVAGPLTIRWTETGGPPVTPPTRQGLGAGLLARALSGGLHGETHMDWRPEGLICELRLPGEALVEVPRGPQLTAGDRP